MAEKKPRPKAKPGLREQAEAQTTDFLDDLFNVNRSEKTDDTSVVLLERDKIDANPGQPRRRFDLDELKSLGESLRNDGQLQPILVRPHPLRRGRYQIVAGERRWRAAGAEYGDVPMLRATVRELTDEQVLRLGLIENVQRSDLTALEKGRALSQLKLSPQGDKTLRDLEKETGLKKSQIQRLLALLDLPEAIIKRFDDLNLNEIHGRALLSLSDDRRAQNQLFRSIEIGQMSGNEALRVAESLKAPAPPDTPPASGPSTWTTTPGEESVSRETNATATSASTSTPIAEPVRGVGMSTSGGDTSRDAQSVSRETKPQVLADVSYDPVNQHLQPALNLLAECKRRLSEGLPAPENNSRIWMATKQIRQLLDEIESEFDG